METLDDLPPWARFVVTCAACGHPEVPHLLKQTTQKDGSDSFAIICPKCNNNARTLK